jgi:hypothetical protein
VGTRSYTRRSIQQRHGLGQTHKRFQKWSGSENMQEKRKKEAQMPKLEKKELKE